MLGIQGFFKDTKGMGFIPRLKEFKKELGYAYQRVWKGYDDTYWYSMDMVFIELYRELFTEWRQGLNSYPHNMTLEEWEDTLDHMATLLYNMSLPDNPENFSTAEHSKNKFFYLFSKHFYDLWD